MIVKAKRAKRLAAQRISAGALYPVIAIEADHFRIINDDGQPYLYDPALFEVVDPVEPPDWITTYGEDGERYAYPPPFHRDCFFEKYHDNDPRAITMFWQVVNRWLSKAG